MESSAPYAGDVEAPLKQRLLDAALAALRELDPGALLGAIGVREIARRAGASPASIHHHYGSLDGLAAAVVAHVFDPRLAPVETVKALVADVQRSNLPLDASFTLHGAELDRLTTDPEFHLRMGLWSLGGEQVREPYRAYLRAIDDQLAVVAESLFATWGRTLRPPFDMASYIAARVAFANGSTVRNLVDPDSFTRHHYQRASAALDIILLRGATDRHDADGRLAEINYYPLARTGQASTERARATRARILSAAATLYTSRGVDRTSFEHVAAEAGTSVSTVKRHFHSKHELSSGLFAQQVDDHLVLDRAETEQGDPHAALVEHLTDLAAFVPPRAPQAAAYLMDLLARDQKGLLFDVTASRLEVALPRPLDQDDLDDATQLVVALVIRQALHHPAASAERNASRALGVVLHGLHGPPAP